MSNFLYTVLIIASILYGSSILFVLTASSEEVANYCDDRILSDSHKLSQRKVACSFKEDRK